MSNNRPRLERALRRLIRAAIDAGDLDQQVIDCELAWRDASPSSEYAEEDGDYEADDEAVSETANESDEYMPTTATSMPKYFRRMARRRLRYAYRDLRAALDEEFADDVLPKEVVALLPPEFLVNQVPNEQADEIRKIGREKGLKGEGLEDLC